MTPQPQTFAELWRGRMSTVLFVFGLILVALFAATIVIIWRGGWPVGTEAQRLNILGWAVLGELVGILAVIVSLAIGGPVGRFKGRLGRDGAEVEAEDRDDPAPGTTVTTTTEVKP